MMLFKKTFAPILFVVFILCSLPHTSWAQAGAIDAAQGTYGSLPCSSPTSYSSGFVPLACYNGSPQIQAALNGTAGSLPQYFNNIFTIALSVGAILAVLRIAYAGYMYMGSADMWGNKQQAKEMLGDAIIGLLLLFGIYLIFNQINPNLLNLDVTKDLTPVPTVTGGFNTAQSCGTSGADPSTCIPTGQ